MEGRGLDGDVQPIIRHGCVIVGHVIEVESWLEGNGWSGGEAFEIKEVL